MLQHFTNEGTNKRLILLEIPDDYQYMDAELVAWLTEAVEYQLAL